MQECLELCSDVQILLHKMLTLSAEHSLIMSKQACRSEGSGPFLTDNSSKCTVRLMCIREYWQI